MNTLVKEIESHGLKNKIFTNSQLAGILGGSDARRYSLVNRAIKSGNLVRLKRGMYCLPTSITKAEFLPHPFGIAQCFVPNSYVSFETALRFFDWIPEAVYTTACVSPNRKSVRYRQETLGWFTYMPLSINEDRFLAGVSRYDFDGQVALVASPLRAVMDIVTRQKQEWSGLDYFELGLRVEDDDYLKLEHNDFECLREVYKSESVNNFLTRFEEAVAERKNSREQ